MFTLVCPFLFRGLSARIVRRRSGVSGWELASVPPFSDRRRTGTSYQYYIKKMGYLEVSFRYRNSPSLHPHYLSFSLFLQFSTLRLYDYHFFFFFFTFLSFCYLFSRWRTPVRWIGGENVCIGPRITQKKKLLYIPQ